MQQAISLLSLSQIIKDTLDEQLLPNYWVVAEIAELKQGTQGHAYLDLVEKDGRQILAKMRANIWSYSYRTIAGKFSFIAGQELRAGMKVLALVSVTFHEVFGFSLNIKDIDPNYTLGERAKIRQEIIQRLTQEGWMDQNKRLQLPIVPQKIAIISSSTAAGYGDFINQLSHNRFGYRVHHQLFQATLQGSDAPPSMINALQQIEDLGHGIFDAVVLIRGGGAALDLDCFDDYGLAVKIAKCSYPVLTGIGHERDETIADLVAHTKVKTPTALAEFLLSGFHYFEEQLDTFQKRMERAVGQVLLWEDRNIRDLKNQLQRVAQTILVKNKEKLEQSKQKLKALTNQSIRLEELKLSNLTQMLQRNWNQVVQSENKKIEQLEKDVWRLDPKSFLEKGYTRTEINGVPLHLAELKEQAIMSTFAKGIKVESIIQHIEKDEK